MARARDARPDPTPDAPCAFAAGWAWFAVASADAAAVARALGLRTVLPANWRSGLAAARSDGVFVTPPCADHVLVVGQDVARRSAADDGEGSLLAMLATLSRAFGQAAWFCTDPAAERHGWALASAGLVVRAYEFTGEGGAVVDRGAVTPAEAALGCFVDDPRDTSDDPIKWWPNDRLVRALAAAWATDPGSFDAKAGVPSAGWWGRW